MNDRNFKQTEMGKIPRDWEMMKLGEVISLEYGKGLSEIKREQGRYPVFGSNGVIGFHNKPIVNGPGIVVGRKGTIGALSWADSDFWPIDTTYYVKILDKEIDLKWLFFALVKLNLPKLSMSDVVPGLKRELVYSLKLPLPRLPEQKKIAEILSTVDQAIEKVDEAIEKTQKLKKGLMQELLTKGIGHKEFKDTEIGRIPKKWKVKSIMEIGTLQYGITKTGIKVNTGVKFLRITDITDEGIKWHSVPYCELAKSELQKYELKDGDILFARIGATTGKTCFIEKSPKSVFGSYLLRMQSLKDIDTKFLYFFTQSLFYWNQVNAVKGGQLKGGLNTKLLGNIKLSIPPLSEQQKIAEILRTVDKRLESLRNRKEKLERIKKGLMNDLLTGKVRVTSLISEEVPMREIEEIKNELRENMPILRDKYKVKTIGVFGSYIRGEQGKESDIDILVEFYETIDLFTFIQLEEFLSETLGIKVDLVMKDTLKPRIKDNILREAVTV